MSEVLNNQNLAELQLRLIKEVHELLSFLDIPHWLDGGWALDFLLGEISREHKDIDWLIWKKDALRVRAVLTQHRYCQQTLKHPAEHIGFYKQQVYVSFTLNELNEQGQVVTSGRWRDWPYPTGALSAPWGQLRDLRCPIVSAAAQLDVRQNYHLHPAGAPMRAVDALEIKKLQAYIAKQNESD